MEIDGGGGYVMMDHDVPTEVEVTIESEAVWVALETSGGAGEISVAAMLDAGQARDLAEQLESLAEQLEEATKEE